VCSIAAAAAAIPPVPLLDIALLAPIQTGMVQGIGRIYGQRLDRKSVLEILSTFGASLVSQSVIMAAAKLLPFFGWAAAVSMAYALTHAIGEVSDHYFRTGPPGRRSDEPAVCTSPGTSDVGRRALSRRAATSPTPHPMSSTRFPRSSGRTARASSQRRQRSCRMYHGRTLPRATAHSQAPVWSHG
jgi:uncharacterized protein (DUF697 family)